MIPQQESDKTQSEPSEKDANTKQKMDWARRLKKVFDIDVSVCPNCQGQMKVISAIEDTRVIKKILNHLNLPSEAPLILGPRAPPNIEDNMDDQYSIFSDSQLPPNW